MATFNKVVQTMTSEIIGEKSWKSAALKGVVALFSVGVCAVRMLHGRVMADAWTRLFGKSFGGFQMLIASKQKSQSLTLDAGSGKHLERRLAMGKCAFGALVSLLIARLGSFFMARSRVTIQSMGHSVFSIDVTTRLASILSIFSSAGSAATRLMPSQKIDGEGVAAKVSLTGEQLSLKTLCAKSALQVRRYANAPKSMAFQPAQCATFVRAELGGM